MKEKNRHEIVATSEELEIKCDEELHSLEGWLRKMVRTSKGSTREAFEVELCYVLREIQIREARHLAHEEWLRLQDLGPEAIQA